MGWRTLWWGQQRSARTAGSLVFSKSHVGSLGVSCTWKTLWLETSTGLVCGKFRNATFPFIAKTPGECAIHSEQLFRLCCNSVRWHSSCLGCSRWWWWQFSSAGTRGDKKSWLFPTKQLCVEVESSWSCFPLGVELQDFSLHLYHCNECPHFHENGGEPNPIYPVESTIYIYINISINININIYIYIHYISIEMYLHIYIHTSIMFLQVAWKPVPFFWLLADLRHTRTSRIHVQCPQQEPANSRRKNHQNFKTCILWPL